MLGVPLTAKGAAHQFGAFSQIPVEQAERPVYSQKIAQRRFGACCNVELLSLVVVVACIRLEDKLVRGDDVPLYSGEHGSHDCSDWQSYVQQAAGVHRACALAV